MSNADHSGSDFSGIDGYRVRFVESDLTGGALEVGSDLSLLRSRVQTLQLRGHPERATALLGAAGLR